MNAKVILICLMAVVATNAYSTGAPDDACFDMVPQHHVDPQSSVAPYQVTLSNKQIKAGGAIEVTISGIKRTDTIKGFMVQARVGATPVDRWELKNHPYGQTLNCGSGSANVITHKKIDGDGPAKLTFVWHSPPELKENVQFLATVALNGGVFGSESNRNNFQYFKILK